METLERTQMVQQQRIHSVLAGKPDRLHTVSPDVTVFEAVALMAEMDIGAVPVLDNVELVGMVSERDYARKVILAGKSSRSTPVREIMAACESVSPETTVGECLEIMTHRRTRHLTVTRDNRLVGIVSIGDLVNAIIAAQDHAIAQLSGYIAGDYPK